MFEKYYLISNDILEPCIVHTCNGFTWSGGLADRLKGIVSVFEWCKSITAISKLISVNHFLCRITFCQTNMIGYQTAFLIEV